MPNKKKDKKHITYHDVEQGSPEWHVLRGEKVTGSNAYLLLRNDNLQLKNLNQKSTFTGNFYTRRGHLLESEAVELYNKIKNVVVQHTGIVTNTKYPNCAYSPDGYLDDRTIEVKCFNVKRHLETAKRVPLGILAQCHFGQLILEVRSTDLILYNPDSELPPKQMLIIKKIPYDKDIQANFKERIKALNVREEQRQI